jgi:hypothetical protein
MKAMSPELASWLRSRTDDSVTVKRLHGDVSGRLFWRVFSKDGTLVPYGQRQDPDMALDRHP